MADFTVSDLDDLVSIATKMDPPIQPAVIGGREFYFVMVHPRHLWWLYVGSYYACAACRRTWLEKATAWLKRGPSEESW